ncbi:MAG: ARPP-1 family domain-containing protein [Candidatus Xenobium sp.]|jgi:hypothetical protein|nr:hypothetical protein [Burkholderiales bacterium]
MRNRLILALLLVCAALPVQAGRETSPHLTLETLLARVRVGPAETHGNLAVFPVIVPKPSALADHLNLDAALNRQTLKLTEVSESGSVNRVLVENTGKVPVFIMAGEILSGAKQDRVLQDDLWLPALSGPVEVACYCVEQGRWSYTGDREFKSRPVTGNLAIRQSARSDNSQVAVWSAVAETQARVGFGDSTALGETFEAPVVKRRIEGYIQALGDLPERHPQASGFVVAVGSRILAADLFGDRADAVALWPKLLPSYALEAAQTDSQKAGVDRETAARFLREAASMKSTTRATPGEGTLFSLEGSGRVGSALLLGRALVHAEVFPRSGKTPPPPPVLPIQRPYVR